MKRNLVRLFCEWWGRSWDVILFLAEYGEPNKVLRDELALTSARPAALR